jgi:hypothetical protein
VTKQRGQWLRLFRCLWFTATRSRVALERFMPILYIYIYLSVKHVLRGVSNQSTSRIQKTNPFLSVTRANRFPNAVRK